MSGSVPPPPGPDDAVVTPGLDNPVPDTSPIVPADRTDEPEPAPTTGASAAGKKPVDVRPLIPALSVGITALHLVMTVVGVIVDADPVRNGVAVISVALFFLGAVSFIVAFVLAAGRSRYEDLWFGGAFFLTGGVVPARARTVLMGCLAVQCVVGLLGASLAPFTPVAFVVLVPLAAMGLMSLYGARWGEFSTKADQD